MKEIVSISIVNSIIVFVMFGLLDSSRILFINKFTNKILKYGNFIFYSYTIIIHSLIGTLIGIATGCILSLIFAIFKFNYNIRSLEALTMGIYVTLIIYTMISKRNYELVPTINSLLMPTAKNAAICFVSLLCGSFFFLLVNLLLQVDFINSIFNTAISQVEIVIFLNLLFAAYITVLPPSKIFVINKNCNSKFQAPINNSSKPNIILITIDALRTDKIGCYENKKINTPNIDALAKEGIVFKQHFCDAPVSGTSFPTIFTGKNHRIHGATHGKKLHESNLTLAEILNRNGYRTAGFTDNYMVGSKFGIERGFDFFYELNICDYLKFVEIFHKFVYVTLRRTDRFIKAAQKWISKNKNSTCFLWLHLSYPHAPYDPPRWARKMIDLGYKGKFIPTLKNLSNIRKGKVMLKDEDINSIESLYEGEVIRADIEVGKFIKYLKELGIYDQTIIILTSDHGETLFRKNRIECQYQHEYSPYDDALRVPLIIKNSFVKVWQKIFEGQTATIDLAPTILDMVDIKTGISFQGQSLLPFMEKKDLTGKEYIFAETRNSRAQIVRSKDYKLIYWESGGIELYNVEKDPYEEINIVERNKDLSDSLKKVLFEWLEENPKKDEQENVYFDKEVRHQLKALGYSD